MLFHENEAQREVIDNLRSVDIPATYPGVVVQEFTKSGLQRMFAIRRYVEQVPSRHPLLLSNVDEYWLAYLGREELLGPIPRSRLKLYSIPDSEVRTKPPTEVIKELVDSKSKFYLDDSRENYLAVPEMANVGMLVYRKDLLAKVGAKNPPETWEKLEDICQRLRAKGKPHLFLLETQTYDTLLVTALELSWGHGVFWEAQRTGNKLDISFSRGDFKGFVSAILRLKTWIHEIGIVPQKSTVDPSGHPEPDWVFARHWYSTWVDVRTRRDKQGNLIAKFPDGAEFGIARIPISRKYAAEQGNTKRHHSAWGEWYLAMQRGSENVDLGVEIINNLMTARKISERALSGAGLPIAETFYEKYGWAMCPETDRTFNEIREMFFPDAQSRTRLEEYRTVGRILSGALQAVITNPVAGVAEVELQLQRAFDELRAWVIR